MDLIRPVAEYTRDELKALLLEGAKYDGGTPYQAAVHIVSFLSPPPAWVTGCVTVDDRWSFTYKTSMRVALVTNWPALLRHKHWGHTERCMLAIASSFATGKKISLDEVITGNLGHAHLKAVAEAMFIRAGADKLLTVGGTGELAKLQAMYEELSGGPSREEAQAQFTDGAERRAGEIGGALPGLPPGAALTDEKLTALLRDIPDQP